LLLELWFQHLSWQVEFLPHDLTLEFLMRMLLVSTTLLLFALPCSADTPTGPVRSLGDYGSLKKKEDAQSAYEKAIDDLKGKGGILLVPGDMWKLLKDVPLQGLVRTPAPPAQTKVWKTSGGVTVVVLDDLFTTVQVPPLTGLHLDRHLRLKDGDSLPHWGTHPMLTLDNRLTYGSTSYLDWLQVPVKAGKDRRFYVATVRGLRPGMFINAHGGKGYGGGVARICIKSIGYDAEKRMHYFVADTDMDHEAGAILHNKSNTGLVNMIQTSNNDNQTYDVKVARNQYAHGDTYIYYCDFNYMSNVHSAAGDENGNCFAAFIRTKDNNFHGTIESVDWESAQLKFTPAARNVETLGDSRPLINLNPKKWISQGSVVIVPPKSITDPVDTGEYKFEGRTYPTHWFTHPNTGVKHLQMGGLIRGDKDCPWTQDVVGRYFAVTSPTEKTPHGLLRWYLITSLKENSNGTKDIEIRRYWWGARNAGSPTLYSDESYTWDGHVRPLTYVIAPGSYVNDVSRAIPGGDRGGQRVLGMAPYRDQGSAFDFAKGDPVEQAIGPDPFKPQAFRVWMWEDVPGAFPAAVLDLRNNGVAPRHSAMTIAGGAANLDDVLKTKSQKPAWDNIIVLNSAAGVGLNCRADFGDAAILFQQPHREQSIKWHYDQQEGAKPKEASLIVSKASGELTFKGGGVRTGGPVAEVAGLSGDKTQSRNLRGKNIAVEAKATTLRVRFPQAEADGDYAVFIEQTWLTNRAVTEKTAEGFTITFATPAPDGAKIDWFLVR
jgi:hypothetical protein